MSPFNNVNIIIRASSSFNDPRDTNTSLLEIVKGAYEGGMSNTYILTRLGMRWSKVGSSVGAMGGLVNRSTDVQSYDVGTRRCIHSRPRIEADIQISIRTTFDLSRRNTYETIMELEYAGKKKHPTYCYKLLYETCPMYSHFASKVYIKIQTAASMWFRRCFAPQGWDFQGVQLSGMVTYWALEMSNWSSQEAEQGAHAKHGDHRNYAVERTNGSLQNI